MSAYFFVQLRLFRASGLDSNVRIYHLERSRPPNVILKDATNTGDARGNVPNQE